MWSRAVRCIVTLTLSFLVAPLAVTAQPRSTVPRIGILIPGTITEGSNPLWEAFQQGLHDLGYVEGKTIVLEYRFAAGQNERLPALAAELMRLPVDVLVTAGSGALAAKRATATIPIVFTVFADPVAEGLVASLARPGGNITGLSDVAAELAPKRLGLLREAVPTLRRVAMLWNASDLGMTMRYEASATVAKDLGVVVQSLGVREPDDFETAFAAMTSDPPDGILMVSDALTFLNRKRVYDFALARRLPAIYEGDQFVRSGGLMSYGPDVTEGAERAAYLIDRILKGTSPADLPLEQPTRFRLAINLKTAMAIGLIMPPALLGRADEVLE